MPSIAGNYNPAVGPLVPVAILEWDPSRQALDVKQLRQFQALIDTGASSTCVSEKVISECNLEATGIVPMAGATGAAEVDKYMRRKSISILSPWYSLCR